MQPDHHDFATDTAEPKSGLISHAKEWLQPYFTLVLLGFLLWLIRWPFYGDEFFPFMTATVVIVTIWYVAAGLWMGIFLLFCRFPPLGIAFLILCAIVSISKVREGRQEECIETRYISTC